MSNKGKFMSTVTGTFKQIREQRAQGLVEDVELAYKRHIEDLIIEVRGYDRNADSLLLDLCPGNVTTLQVVPTEFRPTTYMEKDLALHLNKRNALIKLEIAVDRYEYLFGPYAEASKIMELIPTWTSKISE
jgi:hypothetical protein